MSVLQPVQKLKFLQSCADIGHIHHLFCIVSFLAPVGGEFVFLGNPCERYTSMFAMAQYEVKYLGQRKWEKISEVEVLRRLCDAFDRVTPSIQEMIQGKRVLTPNAIYRIRRKGG